MRFTGTRTLCLLAFLLFISSNVAAQTSLSVPSVNRQCGDEEGANGSSDGGCVPPNASQPATNPQQASPPTSLSPADIATLRNPNAAQPGTNGLPQNRMPGLESRYPAPPEPPTEFQKFVYSSTGERLPIYGHSLFDNVPSTFAPVDRVPVPVDYVVGPGDELLIRAWGQIDLDARIVVDRDGQVYLPKVGAITVAGLKYDQLHDYLQSAIGQVFKNFDLNVNLGQLRSIQVFVVGQARHPGAYTVSSLSTLLNTLFASGGPAADGTMRDIQLKRGNQVVTDFDVYDVLVKGDKSKDAILRPGDVIYIPPVGHQVAIAGSVNLPGIYELRDATRIDEGILMAGGLSTTADASRAVLERIENRSTRQVEEFALDSGGLARSLQDGDVLRIFPVSPRFENAVTVRGNVAQPGRYPWRDGMRICDLIPSRDMLVTRVYWTQQNALGRTHASWTSGDDGLDGKTPDRIAQQGAHGYPDLGWIDGEDGMDLKEQPTEVNHPAEINWDYAVVQRMNPVDLTSHLLPFNLGRAIDQCASPDNLALEAGDVITIFSQRDLAVPLEERTKFVSIEGEVKVAGIYRVKPGETLRDVVKRAGGLTPNAYLYAADFRRESARVEQQKQIEKMVEETDNELRVKAASVAANATSENALATQEQIKAEQDLLNKMRSIQATGRIVLELRPGDNSVNALPALTLEDGDQLIIPPRPATVDVLGAVYNPNSFIYKPGRTVGDYLGQAGGGTREADVRRVFVVRADGSVISRQGRRESWFDNFESQRLMPGDSIVMPEKIRTGSVLHSIRDWTAMFSQVGLGAAAIQTVAP